MGDHAQEQQGRRPVSAETQHDEGARVPTEAQAEHVVNEALRTLLRAATPEEAVSTLITVIEELGGTLVSARLQDEEVFPVDVTFGIRTEPLLPAAAPYSTARMHLERHLPRLLEDVEVVVSRLQHAGRAEREASLDPLTGLLNRRAVGRVLSRTRAGDAVVVLDLDQFKQLNDSAGHDAGDTVLRALAEVMRRVVREVDRCGRMGGEEFILILPATSIEGAVITMRRLQTAWTRSRPFPVTFSAGLAAVGSEGASVAVSAADEAMYRAKHAGRDRMATEAGEVITW